MDRFKKILYVAGHPPSERGFSCALELARVNDALLTLVTDGTSVGAPRRGLLSGSDHLREQLGLARRRELAALVEEGAALGVRVETTILPETSSRDVVREVVRGGHDLVIKVTEDVGILARLFGSRDQRLIRTCPCPVWLLDPAQRGRFRVVLAAVDVARERPAGLGRKIVQLASSLARKEEARLHVVHALCMIGESVLRSGMRGLGGAQVDRILEGVREERVRLVEGLLASEAPNGDARVTVEKGDPARVIRSLVRRYGADVVVMGTVGRTGLEGLLVGNAVEDVLGRVHASLLVVKPDGFETTVELPEPAASRGRSREPGHTPRPRRPDREGRGTREAREASR